MVFYVSDPWDKVATEFSQMESGKGYCPTFKVKVFICGILISVVSKLSTFFSSIYKVIIFSWYDTLKDMFYLKNMKNYKQEFNANITI